MNINMIKVFGHKPPDTDSTCSAIAFAWFLNNTKNLDAEAFILAEINSETKYLLKRFKVEKPALLERFESDEKVAIVDTNNPDELPQEIDKLEIVAIVDHHKLSGLTTDKPLWLEIRPYACTATIIWEMMESAQNDLPKEIAGLMLSAIISDTLKFTSPTTTDEDKKAAGELAKIAGQNIDDLAKEMFDAKSDLSGMNAKDLLLSDSKVYETKNKKVRYSVLETTKPENALGMENELLVEIEKMKKDEGLDHLFFFAVDILKSESHLLTLDEDDKQVAKKAFKKEFDGNVMGLPGVVSRKKQIIPSIEPVISG